MSPFTIERETFPGVSGNSQGVLFPGHPIRRLVRVALSIWLLYLGLCPWAAAQSNNWKSVVIMGGGFVPGLVYSPIQQGLLYTRTDVGGFYRWNNSASRWVPLNDMFGGVQGNFFGGESVAADPVDSNVLYVAAGFSGLGAILRSSNQGDSWTVHSTPISMAGNNDGRNAGERLVVDPNLNTKLYFGSRWQGLWVSADSAATWTPVGAFPVNGDSGYGLSWVIFPPPAGGYGNPSYSESATLFVGVLSLSSGNSNVYRSTDAGANWSLIPGGPSNMMTPRASWGPDGNLWIVYGGGGYGPNGISSGQIWKLDTSTLAWSNVTPSGGPCDGCGGYGSVSVDAQNAQHAIVSTLDWWWPGDQILSTVNGGNSWSVIAMADSSTSVFDVNGAHYQKGCHNGSGGAGWAACVAIDPFNSNGAVYTSGGAGGGGGVWSSTHILSSPVSWIYTDNGLEETVPIYLNPSAAGGILFSCLGDVGGMRHTNVDESPASGMYCDPQFSNTHMLDFAEWDPQIVVRVGNSGMTTSDVAYSTNNGQTWSPWGVAPPGYTSNNQMGSVAVAADGSRVVVSPFDGYGYPAYATSLGGAWTTCSGLPSGACVASDRSSPSTFYAVAPSQWVFGGSVTVYLSTNYGINFTQVNTIPVNWSDPHGNGERVAPRPVFGVPGEFWVSTYNALYRFTHAGSSVTAVPNVYEPLGGVGFGKAAPGQTHPTVFLSGTVQGVRGLHRCDDGTGATWVRINDDDHRYGNPSWMQGDQNIFGRCYVAAGGRGILYGDVSIVSPTVTPTSACGVSPCTDTPTGTPTMTPTLTPAPCLYLLHGCDNLTENGTWSGANASRGVVASCPVTNALPSEGSGCLAVTVLTGSTYNADMMNLSGFTPSHFAGYATLMADVYFPPEMVEGQGWAQLMLIGDSSSNGIWFQNLSSGLLTVTAGLKTYSFALDYPGALTSGMAISKLVFIFNAQNATTGTVYVDNIRLVNPCGVPTPTMTMTATLPFADTATFTPSPTPTESLTVTHTWTRTPTCAGTCVGTATLTETPTFTWTPSFTPTSTETPEVTHTPSRTATPDSAFQMPRSPVIPYPNPVREGDEVTVGVTLLEPGTAQVQLFTTAYRKMRETTLTALPMGFTPARIVLRDREDKPLANGVYFIRVISGDQISIGKLVIRR